MLTEEQERHLQRTFKAAQSAPGPELEARAMAAMARAHAEGAPPVATRQRKWTVRAAAAAVVAVLGLGVFLVPGMFTKGGAKAILADVAHAMVSADSVLVEYRQTDAWGELWARTHPGANALAGTRSVGYIGSEAYYEYRGQVGEHVPIMAQGVDLSRGRWWVYEPAEDGGDTLYVADLTSVEPEVRDVLSRGIDFFIRSGAWDMLVGNEDLADPRADVTVEMRNGREVTILEFTGWTGGVTLHQTGRRHRPSRIPVRSVLEIDTETNHLLGVQYYRQLGDEPEQLVAVIDRVEYNMPVPAYLAVVPEADEVVEATAVVEHDTYEGMPCLVLRMMVGDEHVKSIFAPADWRGDRERAQAPLTPVEAEREQVKANMHEVAIALQWYLADHGDVFPHVDNTYDLMPLLDEYLPGREVFTLPGTGEVLVEYLAPPGLPLLGVPDAAWMPVAVADYHPEFVVIAYADGHVEAADKTDPAYQDRWWEDWWREFEANR